MIKSKPTHFADGFSVLGLVGIILWTPRDKGGNVIVIVQFVCELSQLVAERWHPFIWLACEYHKSQCPSKGPLFANVQGQNRA